jgi:hypothetical protein
MATRQRAWTPKCCKRGSTTWPGSARSVRDASHDAEAAQRRQHDLQRQRHLEDPEDGAEHLEHRADRAQDRPDEGHREQVEQHHEEQERHDEPAPTGAPAERQEPDQRSQSVRCKDHREDELHGVRRLGGRGRGGGGGLVLLHHQAECHDEQDQSRREAEDEDVDHPVRQDAAPQEPAHDGDHRGEGGGAQSEPTQLVGGQGRGRVSERTEQLDRPERDEEQREELLGPECVLGVRHGGLRARTARAPSRRRERSGRG